MGGFVEFLAAVLVISSFLFVGFYFFSKIFRKSGLPAIYYFLAVFCGIVLFWYTAVNSDKLNSTQIGAWIGYTVGAVLSMFAVGRVIELLQQIRDAVRS